MALTPIFDFSWIFLIELLAFGIATILFLFYFNRAFAFVVSRLLRAYTWHRYQVYIDFQALQFSPLAGRIFFKSFRYHGQNETILIDGGFITWKYWLRRVQKVDITHEQRQLEEASSGRSSSSNGMQSRTVSGAEQGGKKLLQKLPCRIEVEAQGLEWFVYNRSSVYDAILGSMSNSGVPAENASHVDRCVPSTEEKLPSTQSTENDDYGEKSDFSPGHSNKTNHGRTASQDSVSPMSAPEIQLPIYLSALPISIECNHGAVVMGNENTGSVLVAKFVRAHGQVDARNCGPLDQYRQCFDFEFVRPVVQLKPNEEYRESQLASGAKLGRMADDSTQPKQRLFTRYNLRRVQNSTLRMLGAFFRYFRKSVDSVTPGDGGRYSSSGPREGGGIAQDRWLGLSRYLDDSVDVQAEQERWKATEYGISSTIVDSPTISVNFFWDVPGPVISLLDTPAHLRRGYAENINGSKPPEWAIDLKIGGGNVNYGPWADRQRIDLQAMFFPSAYADASSVKVLRKGQSRVSTVFQVMIEIEKDIIFRVQTREESKDWKWRNNARARRGLDNDRDAKNSSTRRKKAEKSTSTPEDRPPGWLNVLISRDSCVTYTMGMVASELGFRNKLEIDLKSPEMSTSVNHGTLWRSQRQTISCDLSNPLEWNSLRNWTFDIQTEGLELFIIRDHVYLLTDLIGDWTSGPSGDFSTFIPFNYALRLTFPNFTIHLNVNDSNIINNPSDANDNTFIVVWGEQLTTDLVIPITDYRPLKNKVTFDIDAHHGGFKLCTPTWNTQHTFIDTRDVATLKDLRIDGSYNYCTAIAPGMTDTAILNIHGVAPTAHLYGFLIRYFIKFKDNYFGEDLHFQTLEEYQGRVNHTSSRNEAHREESPLVGLSNDLDVIIVVTADNACFMLPANLYSASRNIKIDISSIALDLRFTNYYMDLEASFSPLAVSQSVPGESQTFTSAKDSSTQAFIDGVVVSGHRLFGLPPAEPTYVCNWDFDIGRITGETSIEVLSTFVSAIKCLAFTFSDIENALPPYSPIVLHDVTFLRARVEPIRVWIHVEHTAVLFSTENLNLDFNDWAGELFSERLHLTIPGLTLACIDGKSASRHRTRLRTDVVTLAFVEASVDIRMVERNTEFEENRRLQQEHVRLHDIRTARTPWLMHEHGQSSSITQPDQRTRVRPVAMPIPLMPEPVKSTQQNDLTEPGPALEVPTPRILRPTPSRQRSFLSTGSIQRTSARLTAPPRGSRNAPRSPSDSPSLLSSTLEAAHSNSKNRLSQQSSTRSKAKTTESIRDGLPPSSMTFSSSFEVPYFPLHFFEPDTHEVPVIPSVSDKGPHQNTEVKMGYANKESSGDGYSHTTFFVHLGPGICALLTPGALQAAENTLKGLQANEPATLLDQVQLTCMADVQNKKRSAGLGRMTQLHLLIPYTGVRYKNTAEIPIKRLVLQHCLNLTASSVVLTGRSAPSMVDGQDQMRSTLHSSLGWLRVAVGGNTVELPMEKALSSLEIYDFTSWVVNDHRLVGEIQLQAVKAIFSDQKLDYLATALGSFLDNFQDAANRLRSTAVENDNCEQFLVHALTTTGEGLRDPALLVGASYVLRSAADHPRNSDTWKMISRLRYILQCLPAGSKQKLFDQLAVADLSPPEDAAEQVIAYFNRWRSWDLKHVRASSLLTKIYGATKSSMAEVEGAISRPFHVSLKVGSTQTIVDTCPEPNEVSSRNFIIVCESLKPLTLEESQLQDVPMAHLSVELLCSSLIVSLNWDIFKLAEDIARQLGHLFPSASNVDATESPNESLSKRFGLHVTATLKSSEVNFKSINLTAASRGTSIGGSLLLYTDELQGNHYIATIKADSISSSLSNQSTVLLTTDLQEPRTHFSLEDRQSAGNIKIWKAAALCGAIDIDVQEDVLGLLGVVDMILGDEVAYVDELVGRLRNHTPSSKESVTRSTSNKDHFSVVLNVDSYTVGVALLPSLKYSIRGEVARTSLRPAKSLDETLVVDVDVKSHLHLLLNHSDGNSQEISVLTVPPINGRISRSVVSNRASIQVFATIETTHLEASAVQGLYSTLTRAEISSLKTNFLRDIELIKTHYGDLFGATSKEVVSPAPVANGVSYQVCFTAAGLVISSVSGKGTGHSARLGFEMKSICLKVSNEDLDTKWTLVFPVMSLSLSSIRMSLERFYEREPYPCGEVEFSISFHSAPKINDIGAEVRSYEVKSYGLEINLYTETASTMVDILGRLQQKFKSMDLSGDVHTIRARRRLRAKSRLMISRPQLVAVGSSADDVSANLFSSMYSLEMSNIQVSWKIGNLTPISPGHEAEDLVLSIAKIDLATKKGNAARLMIENLQVQMVPTSQSKTARSFNSALLPEMVFNVAYFSTPKDRRLAFQAAGKSLDLRLTSQFILPASDLQRSIALASQSLRKVAADWNASLPKSDGQARSILGNKKLSSLLIDADFAGAVVYIQGRKVDSQEGPLRVIRGNRVPQHGRYGQFTHEDASSSTTLRAPGLAWKIEYKDLDSDDPSLNAEIKVDASTNVLYPTVVPLVLEILSSIKEIVGEPEELQQSQELKSSPSKFLADDTLRTADPTAILGNCRLNLGLRICRQEFSLSCQPIARVAATAQFEDIYITSNTVQSADQRFFAVCAAITGLQASVQHVYSRESTGSFEVESINLSLMNSKHVSNTKGLSAILKMSPMTILVNAKQLHDFLLFREIWVPVEMRHSKPSPPAAVTTESQAFAVQRYQQVASAGAFPWNATLSVTKLDIRLDLGQSIGKSVFSITNFWVSSKKSSDWEQNLCLGFDKVGVDSTGRMSGFIELQRLCLRTSIRWTPKEEGKVETPLILASLTFDDLRVKAAFDYQPFLIADLLSLEFLMYNVRDKTSSGGDRLVGIVNGDKVQIFCTTTSSAQAIALYQAIQRLLQDKQAAYEASLKDIEKYLRRNSSAVPFSSVVPSAALTLVETDESKDDIGKTPNQLQTNVVVTLKAINIGAFPSTFFDHQIFKMEALDASARFSVTLDQGKVHSELGLTLGQVRIALSGVTKPRAPKALGNVTVDEVVESAIGSRGGTILKVPRVVATMQTWQTPNSDQIDYIFKSSFEGKVEVGWNYSRISYIRGMWASHTRALAQRLGRPLPPSALQITGGPKPGASGEDAKPAEGEQEKITAVINVPLSRYQYTALQPPIIDTPQLRDMGEATPPLEWIGLHRERLPNLTHQIVIVSLLEVAKEVEDAYSKILGSS